MPRNYSKLIIYGSLGLIVAVGGVMYWRSSQPKTTYETAVVERGTVAEEVTATGSIAASTRITLQAEASGKVLRIPLEEGAEVVEGDLIIEIDSKDVQSQILAQRAAIATAVARLRELEAGPTPEEVALAERAVDTARSRLASAETAHADAVTALANAQKKLDNAVAKADALINSKLATFIADLGDAAIASDDAVNRLTSQMFTSQDFLSFSTTNSQAQTTAEGTRGSARSAVAAIKKATDSAKADGSIENVHAQYAIVAPNLAVVKAHLEADVFVLNYALGLSDATLAAYKQNANTALSQLTASVAKLQADDVDLDLQEKLNEAEVTSAEIAMADANAGVNAAASAVETNRNALAEAEASLAVKLSGSRPESINAQRAVVSAEQARLSGLLTELEKRRIVAPMAGVITRIAVEVGESLQIGAEAAVMNAKNHLEIVTNISEIDIARISIGDTVDITLDAFPASEIWTGSVLAIQPAETVVDNVIFYETRIRFNQEDDRLRSGMTANLVIRTEVKEDVLWVPVRALREDGDRTYVEVMIDEGVITEKDVVTGLRTVGSVEIHSGVKEGETVVVTVREN